MITSDTKEKPYRSLQLEQPMNNLRMSQEKSPDTLLPNQLLSPSSVRMQNPGLKFEHS